MVDGLEIVRRNLTTRPLADYVVGENPAQRKKDEEWLAFVREHGETCSIRPRPEHRRVVDVSSSVLASIGYASSMRP